MVVKVCGWVWIYMYNQYVKSSQEMFVIMIEKLAPHLATIWMLSKERETDLDVSIRSWKVFR
jgi:hypothetical protein